MPQAARGLLVRADTNTSRSRGDETSVHSGLSARAGSHVLVNPRSPSSEKPVGPTRAMRDLDLESEKRERREESLFASFQPWCPSSRLSKIMLSPDHVSACLLVPILNVIQYRYLMRKSLVYLARIPPERQQAVRSSVVARSFANSSRQDLSLSERRCGRLPPSQRRHPLKKTTDYVRTYKNPHAPSSEYQPARSSFSMYLVFNVVCGTASRKTKNLASSRNGRPHVHIHLSYPLCICTY